MQSDTYKPYTDSDEEGSSDDSDSSGDYPVTHNVGVMYQHGSKEYAGERFIDQSSQMKYIETRNKLFSKQLTSGSLYIQSSTYHKTQSPSFNTSNYVATFEKIKSVVGFRLKSANIRVPRYNINTTNNTIKYKVGVSSTIETLTINPGYYTVTELATAFSTDLVTKTQRVSSGHAGVFVLTYFDSNVTMSGSHTPESDSQNGMIFKIKHSSSSVTLLWDNNNITKGAARVFGFHPVTTSSQQVHHSDKPPDFSQHYVDLVIPEIPTIACKKSIFNNGSLGIIDRIPLTQVVGEYLWYKPDYNIVNYFTPIKLDKLTIKLYSDNNELFDSQNTSNSLEFEITVLGA